MTFVIMVADLFGDPAKRSGRIYGGTLFTLVITALLVIYVAAAKPQLAFSNMFVVDQMSTILKISLLVSVGVLLTYSRDYLEKRNCLPANSFC